MEIDLFLSQHGSSVCNVPVLKSYSSNYTRVPSLCNYICMALYDEYNLYSFNWTSWDVTPNPTTYLSCDLYLLLLSPLITEQPLFQEESLSLFLKYLNLFCLVFLFFFSLLLDSSLVCDISNQYWFIHWQSLQIRDFFFITKKGSSQPFVHLSFHHNYASPWNIVIIIFPIIHSRFVLLRKLISCLIPETSFYLRHNRLWIKHVHFSLNLNILTPTKYLEYSFQFILFV